MRIGLQLILNLSFSLLWIDLIYFGGFVFLNFTGKV